MERCPYDGTEMENIESSFTGATREEYRCSECGQYFEKIRSESASGSDSWIEWAALPGTSGSSH